MRLRNPNLKCTCTGNSITRKASAICRRNRTTLKPQKPCTISPSANLLPLYVPSSPRPRICATGDATSEYSVHCTVEAHSIVVNRGSQAMYLKILLLAVGRVWNYRGRYTQMGHIKSSTLSIVVFFVVINYCLW